MECEFIYAILFVAKKKNINKRSVEGGIMDNLKSYDEITFDQIRHFNEEGREYWSTRELMPLLEYSK